jgi:tryptophanyl-tRNA synthetase
MATRVLTGITPTGTPHLGNYAGAIRPAIAASTLPGVNAFFFLADYHALIKCAEPARVARSRLQIAATWLVAGLDPDKVTFYRQSDIPEIPELCWMLTCVTPKGLMNRAHAYKAAVDQNIATAVEPDDGVSMGLFSYPVLMAADILLFNAHKVPVGRDQVQHLEMARDIAQRFNHLYGGDYFVLPEVVIEEDVATLPGLDGRKMSKSYNNTISLFEGTSDDLRSAIMRIITDSREPGVPKDPANSHLYTIYRAFASAEEATTFRALLEQGMGWGDAKQMLYERLEQDLAPMREQYAALMANPVRIEEILRAGAEKARAIATPFMQQLREAVGLRAPVTMSQFDKTMPTKKKVKGARFVSFREGEGHYHFRLLAADGEELLCSVPYHNPHEVGALIRRLQSASPTAILSEDDASYVVRVEGVVVARGPVVGGVAEKQAKLTKVREALASLSEAA